MKIFLGQFYAVMILHKDLVQFGGPGTELAQRCPRNCPWIVLATKITEKEGIVPKVIQGRISIISILSPVASLQRWSRSENKSSEGALGSFSWHVTQLRSSTGWTRRGKLNGLEPSTSGWIREGGLRNANGKLSLIGGGE